MDVPDCGQSRPGVDKDRKTHEIQEGLSCILFAQIAEQLETMLDSREIPILPNLRIPDFVDPCGNEVWGQCRGRPDAHDQGHKNLRATPPVAQ